jgi:hypothetical protein
VPSLGQRFRPNLHAKLVRTFANPSHEQSSPLEESGRPLETVCDATESRQSRAIQQRGFGQRYDQRAVGGPSERTRP